MQACLIDSEPAAMLLPMADPTPVFDDLRAESDELDRLVAELSPDQWSLATPAPRWTIAHQIASPNVVIVAPGAGRSACRVASAMK